MKKNVQTLIASLAVTSIISCGPQNGFQSTTESSSNSSQGNPGSSPVQPSPVESPNQLWTEINGELTGAISSKAFGDGTLMAVEQETESLILLLPYNPLTSFIGRFTSAEHPDITIEVMEKESGKKALGVRIPFKYILSRNTKMQNMGKLPNGDPLPAFPAGEIRGVAMNLNQQNKNYRLTIYFGPQAVAIFVETPGFDLPSYFDFLDPIPVYSKAKTAIVGYFKIVASKGAASGGFYLAARLPRDTSLKLQQVVKF